MDTSTLYYFIELSKDLNMTKTAARLYVSQQSLSSKILRLEETLGTKLFYRKPRFCLTPAGEQVLQFAQNYEKNYLRLRDQLVDFNQEEAGTIHFGASTLRMDTCLPAVLPKFIEKYPRVDISITDTISTKLSPRIISGELDMAIVTTPRDEPVIEETHLMKDEIFFCITDGLMKKCLGAKAAEIKEKTIAEGATLADFMAVPLCLFNNRLGQIVRQRFGEEGLIPKAYLGSTYTSLGSSLCFQGIAASFATRVGLTYKRRDIPDDLNVFRVREMSVPMEMDLRLIVNRERYLPAYARYFAELLSEYFAKIEKAEVLRVGIEL